MENELNQDAQVDSSTTQVEETQQTEQGTQDNSSQSNDTQASTSQQPGTQNEGAVSGQGLPPKENLYGEFRRKMFEEMTPLIQNTIREALITNQSSQTSQSQSEIKYEGKYTERELETIKRHPNATEEDKLFAVEGLAYIKSRRDMLSDLDQRAKTQQTEARQTQALQSIVRDYPQVYDQKTNQWNFLDPLWQRTMQVYNSDPRNLKQFGNEGLRVAMDSAFSQMTRENQTVLKKKEVQINSKQRQIDKNQSQAMTAGTLTPGKQDGANNSKAKIMEAWKKNPDSEEAKRAALGTMIPKSWLT